MEHHVARGLAVLLILALGAACVPYPSYRRVRPEVTLTIRDARQRPIEGARVTLISTEHLSGTVKSRDSVQTGADGIASFPGKRALRIEVLFLYRGGFSFWNWCVEKEGFVTYFTSGPRTKVFSDESVVVLRKGPSKPCPASFR
jgi:hypothetical protein